MSLAQLPFLRRLRSKPRTGWIGIDIGSYSVKLAQLEFVDGVKQIAESAIVPIPESAELTADSVSSGWLTELLREEMSYHRGFRGRNVACGLSMSVTDFRTMNIPPGSAKERREMLAQELAESGNLSSPNFEFDFWDTANPGNAQGGDSSVNVVSIAYDLATRVGEAIQLAKLNCQVLDGGPFALARSIELASGRTGTQQPRAVLDWGHRAAHFVVLVAGQPVFSRMLKDCGVGNLFAAVSQGLGLSTADCQQLLSTCGVFNPQLELAERTDLQEIVDDFAGSLFDQLATELIKTFNYLGTQRAELLPSELWLVGGGATIRNVETKLSYETGISVVPWEISTISTPMGESSVKLLAQAAALSELGWES